MKFRSVFLLLSQVCAFSLWAMSPGEKAEFKRQLKTAATSDDMAQMVSAKRGGARLFTLEFSNKAEKPVVFVKKYENSTGESEIIQAVEECFFEEMEPYLFQGGAIDVENAKFEKYGWANDRVVHEVANIFFAQESHATGPDDLVKKYKYIKERCGQLTGHNTQQDSFSTAFLHKAFGAIKQHQIKLGFLVTIAILCGIYYCWAKKTNKQNNEDEQDTAQNDLNDGEPNEST